ncbi:N-acetylmuramoyl-L-alanine amidase [Brevibacillus reuszeri]|uniref:N-acetylmuramoyl-L-alanine amidase n=1 Tax=Brevibacillus reuszeri TaxID=54915 RepID=UPI000CCBEA7C|nr:N-acetylmuramoyl-L-alanine amidase [Brevibacillus reuszeri]
MQITEMLLTNARSRPRTKITPKGVVIHWTANERRGADALANRNYFNNPTTEASAHYIVDDTKIIRCLPENEMSYHVGAKVYKPMALAKLSTYPNNCTIGIEMCVNEDGSFQVMYQRTVELTASILKRYGWGVEQLWRHYDVTGKNCPAFFVGDDYARKYTGARAAEAWARFQQDIHRLLTVYPQKPQDIVDKCEVQVTLAANGFVINGVSYVPVRAVTEAVGGVVGWEPETKTVTVNGREITCINEKGISYAATRELATLLGLHVEWDGQRKMVILRKE